MVEEEEINLGQRRLAGKKHTAPVAFSAGKFEKSCSQNLMEDDGPATPTKKIREFDEEEDIEDGDFEKYKENEGEELLEEADSNDESDDSSEDTNSDDEDEIA